MMGYKSALWMCGRSNVGQDSVCVRETYGLIPEIEVLQQYYLQQFI